VASRWFQFTFVHLAKAQTRVSVPHALSPAPAFGQIWQDRCGMADILRFAKRCVRISCGVALPPYSYALHLAKAQTRVSVPHALSPAPAFGQAWLDRCDSADILRFAKRCVRISCGVALVSIHIRAPCKSTDKCVCATRTLACTSIRSGLAGSMWHAQTLLSVPHALPPAPAFDQAWQDRCGSADTLFVLTPFVRTAGSVWHRHSCLCL
jgi:hypothetical protein